MSGDQIVSKRKQEHLDICLHQDVSSQDSAGWDLIKIPHKALPEINFSEISLTTTFLGKNFSSPLLISSMTGGSPQGDSLNVRLAKFAQEKNIPMGVGSQRVAIENKSSAFQQIRAAAPKATLYSNIGIVQLNYGVSVEQCQRIVDELESDALILHCNPLQEAIQEGGDRNFHSLFKQIEALKRKISVPLILKETGCGLDSSTCISAINSGVDALDIAGMGGSHWGFIEGLRSPERRKLGEIFRNWGIPTTQALQEARQVLANKVPLVASGGLRNGLDAARAFYLGADLCGMALPFLKAAQEDSLDSLFEEFNEALKIALFCSGHLNPKSLKNMRNIT